MPPKKKICKSNKGKVEGKNNRGNRMRKKPSRQSSSENNHSSNQHQQQDNSLELRKSQSKNMFNQANWVEEQNGLEIDTIKGEIDKESEQQRHKISQQLQKMINNQNANDRNDQDENNM